MKLTKLQALRAYAKMINTRNAAHLEPLLREDFHYASQWVFDEIRSKQAYLDYIKPKLEAIAEAQVGVWAEMGKHLGDSRSPCIVMAQESRDNLISTVFVEIKGGLISRFDMCLVPSTSEVTRTGDYPE